MRQILFAIVSLVLLTSSRAGAADGQYFQLQKGDYPHDVAVAPDGAAWFSGQQRGIAGKVDPATGNVTRIPLGKNSAPHGVIIGPDGAPWFTDGGQNAIVRVDPATSAVKVWLLPPERAPFVNLNTAVFDAKGRVWFTGQNGVYGRLDPASGDMKVWDAPRGRGAYGIATTPSGTIWFVSLANSYLANVDLESGAATVYEPPTKAQGARRIWSDSKGRLWISEWNAGQVAMFDPSANSWKEWKLPGEHPQAYAVWVDPDDKVWLSDWGTNSIVRFDPLTEKFDSFPSDKPNADVRQMLGRKGEVWAAESGTDRLRLIRYTPATQ